MSTKPKPIKRELKDRKVFLMLTESQENALVKLWQASDRRTHAFGGWIRDQLLAHLIPTKGKK